MSTKATKKKNQTIITNYYYQQNAKIQRFIIYHICCQDNKEIYKQNVIITSKNQLYNISTRYIFTSLSSHQIRNIQKSVVQML